MEELVIKIEFKNPLDLDMNEENSIIFKRQLIEKIKEILTVADIEDYTVFKNPDIQDIKLVINNKKSDR